MNFDVPIRIMNMRIPSLLNVNKLRMKQTVSLLFTLFIISNLFSQDKSVNTDYKIPGHPRILLFEGEENVLLKKINKDQYWKELHTDIINETDNIINLPVSERIVTGRRLLAISRESIRRVFYLSYSYRMTKQKKYLDRAEKELLAISAFSDWNPSHFLDVAEMTMACAIGYDWLYDKLPATTRSIIKTAIIEKGLKPSFDDQYNWFLNAEHNWNQVCNAGMTYGALAIYEDDKELATKIINRAVQTIQKPMHDYAPDGAYPEGIGYWDYGTSFNVMFLSAVEKIYKTDFELNKAPGFLETGMYSQVMITPSYHTFNYGDNRPTTSFNSTVFWFYEKTKDPALLYMQKGLFENDKNKGYLNNRLLPAALIWGPGSGASLKNPIEPSSKVWKGDGRSPVVAIRSSWSDPNALYLGFKVGSPSVNHAHMDIGSFIFESEGIRWAIDFGPEDYHRLETRGVNIMGHKDGIQRWDIFRYRTKSHNTLCFNDKQQRVEARADIDYFIDNGNNIVAMSDLSAIYDSQIPVVKRAVSMVDDKYVVIQDFLTTKKQFTKVRWNMLTEADRITFISGNIALLEKEGKKLYVVVEAPVDIRFYNEDTTPTNTYDSPNEGNQFVGFEADLLIEKSQEIKVFLIPDELVSVKSVYEFK